MDALEASKNNKKGAIRYTYKLNLNLTHLCLSVSGCVVVRGCAISN